MSCIVSQVFKGYHDVQDQEYYAII